jgi:WD40 repeat protein
MTLDRRLTDQRDRSWVLPSARWLGYRPSAWFAARGTNLSESGEAMTRSFCFVLVAVLVLTTVAAGAVSRAQDVTPIAIAEIKRDQPVDFEKEVLPIFKRKCLACHSATVKESHLILETPQTIQKGGELGPGVVPGKSGESLLLQVASRRMEPYMPPPGNKVNAAPFTPDELGLMKLWIDQGATGNVSGGGQVQWQPLPPTVNPIFAAAITADGQYAACGRANQVFIYHVPTGKELGRLTDPELLASGVYSNPGVAHLDLVQALAFSPDGLRLASGGYQEVKIWSRPRNVQLHKLPGAGGSVVAVSPDKKWLAAAGADNKIRLFDLSTNKPGPVIEGHSGPISGLRFSADSAKLISASHDKSIRIWNVADGAAAGRLDTPAPIHALALVADGAQLATGGPDNLIRLWAAPVAPPRQLADVPSPATALASSADKKLLALGGADSKIVLVDAASGAVAKVLSGHTASVTSLSFSGNNARLVSSSADKTVRVWDVAAGQQVAAFQASTGAVDEAAINAAGNEVAYSTGESFLGVWKLDAPQPRVLAGDNGAAATVAAVSPNGQLLASDGFDKGLAVIFIREIASGNVVRMISGHGGPITSLAFSPDGARLASGSLDKTARVWNLADGAELAKFEGHGQPVTAVAFNSNGQQVVSGAADNSLKLWNVADKAEIKNFAGHQGAVAGVAFTTDNQFVISGSADQTVRVWNPGDGSQIRSIALGGPATALAVSRDNKLIAAAAADNAIKLFQVSDGNPLKTLAGHGAPVKSLSFSFDHTRLVSGGADNVAVVWDLAAGQLIEALPLAAGLSTAAYGPAANTVLLAAADKAIALHTLHFDKSLPGNTKKVTGLVYRGDGQVVFCASQDGNVRAFQTSNGQQLFAANHGAPIHALALAPNGQWLASAGENNELRIWNASSGAAGPKPQLGGFESPVRSVAFSTDSNRVIGGAANGRAIVFNLNSGSAEEEFTGHAGSAVEGLATAGEAAMLVASIAADKTTRLWPVSAGAILAGHGGPVTALDIMPNNKQELVSASQDGTIRHWNVTNGQQVRTYNHGGPIMSIAVRPDGQRVVSAGANNVGKLWNATNGQQLAEVRGDFRAAALVAKVNTDLNLTRNDLNARKQALDAAQKNLPTKTEANKKAAEALAAADKALVEKKQAVEKATADKTAAEKAVADAVTAVKAATDAVAKADADLKADANNDGLKQAKAAADKALADANAKKKEADDKLAATAKPLADANTAVQQAQQAYDTAKRAADLAAKEEKQAQEAVTGSDLAVKAATEKEQKLAAELQTAQQAATASEKPFAFAAFSPDNLEFTLVGDDKLIHTYDANTGKPFDVLEGHGGPVRCVAYVSANTLASSGADNDLVVWDTDPLFTLDRVLGRSGPGFVDRVIALAFSPDGKLLATGGGEPSRSGEVKIWQVADGALVREISDAHSDTVFGLEFSRDGLLLASSSADKFVKVFDVASGKLQKSFEGHTHHVMGVSWQFDGKVLASCGADNVIKVWSYETGEQQRTIQGFSKQLTGIRFVGNSVELVASCADRVVHRRRANDGGGVRTYGGNSDYVYCVDVTPDGALVIGGGQDGVLRVWDGNNAQVIRSFEPPKPAAPPATAAK